MILNNYANDCGVYEWHAPKNSIQHVESLVLDHSNHFDCDIKKDCYIIFYEYVHKS